MVSVVKEGAMLKSLLPIGFNPFSHQPLLLAAFACATLCMSCGSDSETSPGDPGNTLDGSADTAVDATKPDAGSDASDGAIDAASVDSGLDATADASSDATLEAGEDAAVPVADPRQDGPYAYEEVDGSADGVGVHCAVPGTGPSAGPYPLVLFAHGFLIEPFRYYGYVDRLASFGVTACTVAYSSLQGQDEDPVSIIKVLDWALASSELAGKVDGARVGVMGHSRGGKAAVNAAAQDDRFKAVLGLDPVNTCPMGTCPDAIVAAGTLTIPSGFLGETTDDGTGGGMMEPCAPAADNFQQFYAAAPSPSLSVQIIGANHMSFLDDATGCLQCSVCQSAVLDRETVLEISRAYTVAFFLRTLEGQSGYDAWLTGSEAQLHYVQSGLASIESK